jgi:perosamine synthetase
MTRSKNKSKSRLAIHGGPKTRTRPMPPRFAFGREELAAAREVFAYYRARKVDFGYQGHFEERYCEAFTRYLETAGYADGVATGTAALFVALAAFELPKGSHVLVSPITDPGTVNAIILNQLVPVVMDTMPGSYNSGAEQFEARITRKTRAVVLVHAAGMAAPVGDFMPIARQHGIKVLEDCSQAHGARWKGKRVGTFGDIAAFSTMYRKAHATGGCGGVVFTRDKKLHQLARAYADRGKPFWKPGFSDKNPSGFLFPALNFNLDDLSAAIGIRTLAKLDGTIRRRNTFLRRLERLLAHETACRLARVSDDNSPFFHPIFINADDVGCTAREFGEAVRAEGVDINPYYDYIVSQWEYLRPYLPDRFSCPNARACRDGSFNLLFNENYGDREARDVAAAIRKVAAHFRK